jgi:putative membrane protein
MPKTPIVCVLLAAGVLAASTGTASAAATPADRAFVAKVSQGGAFEVQAGRLADQKGSTPDIRDFGAMEAHDHAPVGDKLKAVAGHEGISFGSDLNADFAGKLAELESLSGPAFDTAYMDQTAAIHAADGAAFAEEAKEGGSVDFRAFAAETHKIVQRHIGAIHAAPPPAR